MRKETIVLAGREFVVAELPAQKNGQWRSRLQLELAPVADALDKAPAMAQNMGSTPVSSLLDLVKGVGSTLLSSADTVREMVYQYAPNVAKERDVLEAEAYDSEFLDAFGKVLGLAYPFGSYVQMLSKFSQSG